MRGEKLNATAKCYSNIDKMNTPCLVSDHHLSLTFAKSCPFIVDVWFLRLRTFPHVNKKA